MNGRYYFQMSTAALVLFLCLSAQIFAQDVYAVREQKAPAEIKQRLNNLRQRIQTRKLKFRVGYTYAREKGVKRVTGGKKPNVSAQEARRQNALAAQLVRLDNDARLAARIPSPNFKLACSANLKSWDWRKEGKVTAVRRQGCGSCWAYAALGALESSYLLRNNKTIDGSEQYIVSNNDNGAGTCDGGRTDLAIQFLITTGTSTEAALPDAGVTGSPNSNIETAYSGVTWGWVNPDNPGNPGVQSIKQALCEHGPVATWIDAGGSFGDYAGGVYDDDDDKENGYEVLGHFVTIIGWDDADGAWLIKNSWGQTWGDEAGFGSERGYGRIKFGTHQVGSDVSWVRARGNNYQLPKRYYELMPIKKIPVLNPVDRRNVVTKPQ